MTNLIPQYDVIIVGAGAAGLMCAIEAGKRGRKVLLLDKASKAGKKILISGGGRCNFTNMYTEPDNYLSDNPHFCKSALSRYTQWDFIALMEKHHLSWTEKTLGQLFCDQKSAAVVKILLDECIKAGVKIHLDCQLHKIEKEESFTLQTSAGNYQCQSLVIATGGPSIPKMGASDFALQVAEQFSISTVPFTPALVPFLFDDSTLNAFIKNLSGISLQVQVSLNTSDNLVKKGGVPFKEAILFTHRGISGPAALQISSYWQSGDQFVINLFPDFELLDWLIEQQQSHPQAELKTILAYKLPKRLATELCNHFLNNKVMRQLNSQELEAIVDQLTHWVLLPKTTEGMRTAEVSLGGINTDEISSKTFETKKVKGLYFVGEAIDVTGHLGGFNFQWAWASAWCAGQYI
ncbi:MAG: NAD(P)/FAD-dependent oxidoreductase [Cocleimonas sp.]